MARTYTLTAATVLGNARVLLGDSNPDMSPRNTDAALLAALNEALMAMVTAAPGLFSAHGEMQCAAGYLQQVEFSRAAIFIDVIGLPEADPATLGQFMPRWMQSTPGTPENFMRIPADPLRFMVYPPATAAAPLTVRFARAPDPIGAVTDVIPVPEHYGPVLTEYVVGRAELADDEHVNSERATALLARFTESVKTLGGA